MKQTCKPFVLYTASSCDSRIVVERFQLMDGFLQSDIGGNRRQDSIIILRRFIKDWGSITGNVFLHNSGSGSPRCPLAELILSVVRCMKILLWR